jgi:acetylornithine deacetylase
MAVPQVLIALTRELVSIPSHHDPEDGVEETAAGDVIEAWLGEHADAAIERDDAPGGGNVIARRGDGDESLALVGHHDVVPPDETQLDDGTYVVEERAGRLHGRGTADMKGGLAAAMRAFADAAVPADRELVFASFVGEERGGIGARAAIEDGFGPDRAVVVEGSTGYSAPAVTDVAVAHKGRRGSTIRTVGTAAHASELEAGVNAIYRATDAVEVLGELDPPTATVLGRDLAGSVAVTEIEGGRARNVIPDRCAITVDERTVPDERADLARVEAIDGVEWTVDQDLPPMACESEAFADAVLDAARAVQDGAGEHVVKPHATDAGWLAQAGTDCLIVGPAERGEAHTADESVGIDVLERCEAIYRRIVETV